MGEGGQRYFIINKPYNMLSQFVSSHDLRLLCDLDFDFPPGTHAIGRLDNLSEGLLILTTNKKVTRLLFQGEVPHKRTYLVKVAYEVKEETLHRLQTGVAISAAGGETYMTSPCDVVIVPEPANLFHHEFETKDYIPHTWLLIHLTEGKFHQVRKMVREVGHKCKRLIRVAIEDLQLENMQPGEVKEIEESTFFKQLKIENWQ
ncbi:23S rRNA pseudouridine2457 synthase [Filimonas lacunae]|uniref:Pseudouridine synthase n=1 Tax=Filimonas lacunae TaxID=477680 RepID=A0A173MRV8_9BACT|nr:pseudouridine synthase [Filimonas lacunae]BAV10078.1 tRNA pseudouridine synthase A [Filimonas lacunae]SIS83664.1 23S rRNA pseudouridine2457 synthase [Filimonas lacunae]